MVIDEKTHGLLRGDGKVKKALSDMMFIPKWNAETFFKETSQAGFSGVEINFCETEGIITKTTSLSDAHKLAHLAANYHLEITAISSDLFTHYAFTSKDKRLRKSAEEIGRRMIEFAAEMDVKRVNILPGTLTPQVPYQYAYEKAVESIKRLGVEAEKAGITLTVENTANKFLPSPKEFVEFINDLDHPAIKVCLNTGHALVTGHPEHFIEALGDRILSIHVKDYREELGEFMPVLEGDINWPCVMNALQNIAYDGYLISIPSQSHKHGLGRHVERYAKDIDALQSLLSPIITL